MHLHASPMPDRESLQAAMYGPLVLAARFEDEPKEKWCRHYQAQTKHEPTPPLRIRRANWMIRQSGSSPPKVGFKSRGGSRGQAITVVLQSSILHERCFVYHEIQT